MTQLATTVRRAISNQVLVDGAVAVALTIVSLVTVYGVVPGLGIQYRSMDPIGLVLLGLQTLPLAVRQRHSMAVWTVTGISITVYSLLGYTPCAGGVGVLIALYTVAASTDRRTALTAAAVTTVGIALSLAGSATSGNLRQDELLVTALANYVIYATAWILGDNIRVRRAYTGALEARAALLERERGEHARLAVAEERARISRELHDVVAHHVSVMVVQAGAARRVLTKQPDLATEALNDIESTGRQALAEMRRMLGVLRSDDAADALAPQPSLERLEALVEQVGEAGLPVDLVVEGARRPLPPGIDVNAYRIVQEALTNVLKHAGKAAAKVRVRYSPRELELEITDDGRGAAAAVLSRTGAGQGVVGMRERAQLHGGELEAGPLMTGGFRVRARLQIDESDAAAQQRSASIPPMPSPPGSTAAPALSPAADPPS